NAAHQQATASGVPLRALSEVEMATFKIVDKEKFEILQLPRTPRHHVMIKEEVHERTAPEGTVTSRLAARCVPLVENWNEHINYQCMRNHDLRTLRKSLIDDQGVVFEGRGGVTYGHPAWTLWDSESTTMGIMPQFAHVNAIRVHELSEPLMLQLGTVGSRAMVQFGMEVKIKASGHPTKKYMDIANFDCYDMIISTPFMHKNKVTLDFVNNEVIVNGMLLKAERIVLADMDGHLRCH
ncbi:hypothetical protein C0995_002270, partial [Termitomyces sp. Mi166